MAGSQVFSSEWNRAHPGRVAWCLVGVNLLVVVLSDLFSADGLTMAKAVAAVCSAAVVWLLVYAGFRLWAWRTRSGSRPQG